MTRDVDQPAVLAAKDETFLQRWSRRKRAAERDAGAQSIPPAIEPPVVPSASPLEHRAASDGDAPPAEYASAVQDAQAASPLPAVESLTFESDFRAFLQPNVPEDLKRQALKKLLHDPRFNVMDGLDVYIDDYSVPSPLEPAVARALAHARYIFEPPQTRVSAEGHIEDVPAAEADASGEDQRESEGMASEDRGTENNTTSSTPATAGILPPPALAGMLPTPALAGMLPHEKRGDALAEVPVNEATQGDAVSDVPTAHAASDDSDIPLLTRRGGTRSCADGVVKKPLEQVAAPEGTPPDARREHGDAPR